MKIKDLINKIRGVHFIQINYTYDSGYHGGYSTYTIDTQIEFVHEFEVEWFEVTTFKNKPCLSIYLPNGVRLYEKEN